MGFHNRATEVTATKTPSPPARTPVEAGATLLASGRRAATQGSGRLDRAVEGVGGAGADRPAGLAVGPVPPLAGVVGEAGAGERLDQEGAVGSGFGGEAGARGGRRDLGRG